jgi:hypothetical protein
MSRSIFRRLGLEEQMIPSGEPLMMEVVFIEPDGTQAPGRFSFEIPAFRPSHDRHRRAAFRQADLRSPDNIRSS